MAMKNHESTMLLSDALTILWSRVLHRSQDQRWSSSETGQVASEETFVSCLEYLSCFARKTEFLCKHIRMTDNNVTMNTACLKNRVCCQRRTYIDRMYWRFRDVFLINLWERRSAKLVEEGFWLWVGIRDASGSSLPNVVPAFSSLVTKCMNHRFLSKTFVSQPHLAAFSFLRNNKFFVERYSLFCR